MKNYLILHGHFYQPPRENPWTGVLEQQPSAAPFHDWNSRITKECYAANSASRILTPEGKISRIINNYRYISYNFGPTLLSWLRQNAPKVYARILEADSESMTRNNGHGNALAQSYNHTILPLDSKELAATQIYWGIEDFKTHFGRNPEGMWLPEAAVNEHIIDELIRQSVKFIILSPWQAEAVCPAGTKNWQPLHGHPASDSKAFKIERPSGSLAVFFYNPTLASGISFSHYLHDADELKNILNAYRNEQDPAHLVQVATDGEIYGHHEPYGDMCLAALTEKAADSFSLTNYDNYLELHPPTDLVKLHKGEAELGTSWSCSHGVSRWRKDCGCSTGGKEGWNQAWRTPLRSAMDFLRKAATGIYISECARRGIDNPNKLRNEYIAVLNNAITDSEFLQKCAPGLAEDQQQDIFRLLEGQKYMMYMFTSCGWFFSDISGIEPVHNMAYAARLIYLYKKWSKQDLLENFLADLSEAGSNIPEKGTGRTIMETEVLPQARGKRYGAAVLFWRQVLNIQPAGKYGIFEAVSEFSGQWQPGTSMTGHLIIRDCELREQVEYSCTIPADLADTISLEITDNSSTELIPVAIMPPEIRSGVSSRFMPAGIIDCMARTNEQFSALQAVLNTADNLQTDIDQSIIAVTELVLSNLLCSFFSKAEKQLDDTEFGRLEELIQFKNRHGLKIHEQKLTRLVSKSIGWHTDKICSNLNSKNAAYMKKLCSFADFAGLQAEITIPQNIVWELLESYREKCFRQIEKEQFDGFMIIRNLINIGDALGIDVEELKKRLMES